jgi:hypothetical protein
MLIFLRKDQVIMGHRYDYLTGRIRQGERGEGPKLAREKLGALRAERQELKGYCPEGGKTKTNRNPRKSWNRKPIPFFYEMTVHYLKIFVTTQPPYRNKTLMPRCGATKHENGRTYFRVK